MAAGRVTSAHRRENLVHRRIRALHDLKKEAAAGRIRTGDAALSDYKIVLGERIDALLQRLIPTLMVVRAQRLMRITPGAAANEQVSLARQVLAHHPDERLGPDLTAGLVRLDAQWSSSDNLTERLIGAQARLLIGPAEGALTRQRLWEDGLAEQRAAAVIADPCHGGLAELIADWTPWRLEQARSDDEGDHRVLAKCPSQATLGDLAAFMYAGGWTSQESANFGQSPPKSPAP